MLVKGASGDRRSLALVLVALQTDNQTYLFVISYAACNVTSVLVNQMSDNAIACGFENRQIAIYIAFDLP